MLLLTLFCLSATGALAADYGTAVIDAPSGKLHLREEPSSHSDSMGLYFTGTRVECRSDPGYEWVEVQIGRERGYMMSKYLKRGSAGDRVGSSFMYGMVIAKNWGRLRAGPSTEYQFICKVNNGTNVTIMGETVDHWYYVQAGRETGFMSSSLIRVNSDYTSGKPQTTKAPSSSTASGWKSAYRSWITQNGDTSFRYTLIDVDRDNIPELAVDTGAEAGGCQILTYYQGRIDVLQTYRRGFTYIQRGNALCNSDGHMDSYFDLVYKIENGKWVMTASGEYYGYTDEWDEERERYVCQNYVFNGKQTDMEGYYRALDSVYPPSVAVEPAFEYSHAAILRQLQ